MKLTSSMAGKDPPPGDQGPLPASLLGWPFPTILDSFLPNSPSSYPLPLPGLSFPGTPFPPGPLLLPPGSPPPLLSGPPRLPWSQVLAFAAAVAQDGFNVTHDLGQWGLGVGERHEVVGKGNGNL